jgi:hypothetical protein
MYFGGLFAPPTKGHPMNTSDSSESTPTRRLGYWLRTVDALLVREFATAFENEGVTRREWMLLNAVSGDITRPGLAERLARKGKGLRRLEERGWIVRDDSGVWTLTADGSAAKERLGHIAEGVRERVASAVTPEEFATTLASLEAIARELGGDDTEAWPRGRGSRRGHHGDGFGRHHGHHGAGHRSDGEREHRGGRGCAPRDGHGHGHGRSHTHRHGHRHAERAFERGFDAGFIRGREA